MPISFLSMTKYRIFSINSDANTSYCKNSIKNNKYNVFNFIPLVLMIQFSRFTNMYFLMVAASQVFKEISPVDLLTTWIPIFIIFVITMIREAFDDIKRRKEDSALNHKKYHVIRSDQEIYIKSCLIQVGDIVILHENEKTPADLILLKVDGNLQACSIQTSSLDGETNLKDIYPIRITKNKNYEEIRLLKGQISCNTPNPEIYYLSGKITLSNGEECHLSKDNFIQFGTTIINSHTIYGIVCYAGKDTKIALNSQKAPVKWTKLEHFLDSCSLFVFTLQLILALTIGTYANYYTEFHSQYFTYLRYDLYGDPGDINGWKRWLFLFLRFFLLTTSMIPISLKLTIDICKFIYGFWISHDLHLIDKNKRIKPLVNNSSVIEDLGAIEYMFVDKTGTLTENVMKFKKLAVESQIYGHSMDADSILLDNSFKSSILNRENENDIMALFCLSFCHTVKFKDSKINISNSPEDTALIEGLIELGVHLNFDESVFTIESENLGIERQEFQVISIIPFSYERKRMSVLLHKLNSEKYYLFSKGSPDSIANISKSKYSNYDLQINQLASLGYRILGLSYRTLSEEEAVSVSQYLSRSMNDDAEYKDATFQVEQNSELLGIAAVEDRLQEKTGETIEILRQAGIKIWMITGDIFQTACNISFSARLIGNDGPFILIKETDEYDLGQVLDNIESFIDSLPKTESFYLAIDDFYDLLLNDYKEQFFRIAMKAKSVICSRASPNIKADVVKCIKDKKKITLAIGDGGNDIPMISIAHIGVGIIGREGRQAAAASDFAFTNFRFLTRLLLIHGRYSMHRTSWLTQFCFYKSAIFCLIQVLYMTQNAWSASSYFNNFNVMSYNAIFTILPVIFYVQDKDMCESSVLLHPYIYSDSQHSIFCNRRTFFWWYIRAFFQAFSLYSVSAVYVFDPEATNVDGSAYSLDEAQQITFSALILIVILTVTLDSHHMTILNLIFTWGNWIIFILLSVVANLVYSLEITKDFYLVVWRVLTNPIDWIAMITMVSLSVFVPFILSTLKKTLYPSRTERLHSIEIKKQSEFQPEYFVSNEKEINDVLFLDEKYNPKTVWDKTHSICYPFCPCSNH
ncbi:Phospholipid-transporting ATPase 2 [Tritrichomonas foetus]|uniref:Phospholipid-transporting ATPase n=1 Tax=Tritrichomonas foetus TaxID=1144522 RepID=A0A1J4JSM1_9EUKA|nr:Phospholipid-transporting ATPase 2 [Tritrichomonas foetus]|eukprot:OHT00518.1 Phospholipid-transporting ATPase 2 [Tritrichomonas foetus]